MRAGQGAGEGTPVPWLGAAIRHPRWGGGGGGGGKRPGGAAQGQDLAPAHPGSHRRRQLMEQLQREDRSRGLTLPGSQLGGEERGDPPIPCSCCPPYSSPVHHSSPQDHKPPTSASGNWGPPPAPLSIPPIPGGLQHPATALSPPHPPAFACAARGVVPLAPSSPAEGWGLPHRQGCGQDTRSQLMGMTPPPPPPGRAIPGRSRDWLSQPVTCSSRQTSPTHSPSGTLRGAASRRGEGSQADPTPLLPTTCPAKRRHLHRAQPPHQTPSRLPHAPLQRRPVLRSRGKSSFKNTSSKALSVSGGGCRGRGGREGDAAALDTEVTGRGGGRGRRAGAWACVHTRVCVHIAPGHEKVSPQPPACPTAQTRPQFPCPQQPGDGHTPGQQLHHHHPGPPPRPR